MARYEISAPDGGKYEVTAPDGMSEGEVLRRFQTEIGVTPRTPAAPARDRSWGEYLGGLARQGAQGLSFGFADELEAGARSLVGGRSYGDIVGEVRRENEEFAQDNPGASLTANLVGGIVPFTGGPLGAAARWAMRGATLPRTAGRSALLGAGAGGAAGLGAGEGDLMERMPSGLTGAAFGGAIGAAIPPVFAGAGRGLEWANNIMRRGRARPSADYQPPVPPMGRPIEGARFVNDVPIPPTQEALGAQKGALKMIDDWITSAGGSIEGLDRAWQAAQRSRVLHSSGEAINAQTLAELYPPLQRLLRAAASGYREVGEDVTRFLRARHTGIASADEAAGLAQRGIPTRERFMPGRTVAENRERFGVELGTGDKNISPTGQLGRMVDEGKRLFRIKDSDFHGHAANANRTVQQIMDSLEKTSLPARKAAFGAGDMVDLRPAIGPILTAWGQRAAEDAPLIGTVVRRALRQFYTTGGGKDAQMIRDLRRFDRGKRALDKLIQDNLGSEVGFTLQNLKRELLAAVDGIKQGRVGELYARARGIYAGGMEERDILTRFRDHVTKSNPDATVGDYDALTTAAHRKLARLGYIWGIEDANLGRRGAQDATLLLDTNRVEQTLTALGRRTRARSRDADEVMRRFGNYIGGEQEMVRGTAKTVVGGSMTDRNLQDALAMGTMEIAQNVQSLRDIARGSTSFFDLASRGIQWAYNRAFGMSADRAREVSRLLLTANPQEITAIIAWLRMTMPASRMRRFEELMSQVQRSAAGALGGAGAVGGAAAGQQPSPGFI
jgi:hypothetical protein